MSDPDRRNLLIQQLMAAQSRLYAYATALVHDPDAAQDVLQNANVVMLAKLDEVAADQNLLAWAQTVVRYEVLSYRRDLARDRLRFSDAFIDQLADAAARRSDQHESRSRALYHCLGTLPDTQRRMIEQRYAAGSSVERLAESLGRPHGSVRQALYRIRLALIECVHRTLAADGIELRPDAEDAR